MSFNFIGKKVLVTGAGRGVGRGLAIALCKSGCKVYALSRTQSTVDTLVKEHSNIMPIVADLCNWEDTREKLEKLEVLDGLVNNAAIEGSNHAAVDTPKEYIDKLLENNLLSAINCTQVIAKKMIESKVKGSIVNVSSTGSLAAFPKFLAYTVSKAGLDMVSKQFALELGPHGIRVNSVNSGVIMTPLVERLIKDGNFSEESFTSRSPMGRILQLREIVDPILYLLSDHSSMVTGQTHIVDGGCMSNITVKV